MIDVIKVSFDVYVQYEAYPTFHDDQFQGSECIMPIAIFPESVGVIKKVLLIDCTQYLYYPSLDYLVLQHQDS